MLTLQAIELDGTAALPHIAACTSMGRLALLSDNKTKVKLAHDAREEAVTALALEPSNDLAHHLMGRWHYEMANLNVVVRTLVRVMFGTALASGTHLLHPFQSACPVPTVMTVTSPHLHTLCTAGCCRQALNHQETIGLMLQGNQTKLSPTSNMPSGQLQCMYL